MKKIIFSFGILFTALCGHAQVPTGTQTAGIKVGTYFGGTYKAYISSSSSIEGTVGLDWELNNIGVIANYYMIQTDVYEEWDNLEWYGGVGGQVWLGNASSIGPNATVGLEYYFDDAPFTLFTDFSLYLGFGKYSGFIPQFGVGARKTF